MDADASTFDADASTFQQRFHARWADLRHPHVRALAWLLDAPDLLDPDALRWQGKIARLPEHAADGARDWLIALEAEPESLLAALELNPFSRLGRYAEKLLALYFEHRKQLVAHGLQVRAGKEETVGEFDFLLSDGVNLLHWEFATKFYLLCSSDPAWARVQTADYFVGPNLSDTLGAKMRKILDRQLSLGQHPAAQALLPQPISLAQALLRGWLFYRRGEAIPVQALGITEHHCRGWWCTLTELDAHLSEVCAILPRLAWLAPARMEDAAVITRAQLQTRLLSQFQEDAMPVMVASLTRRDDAWLETDRGFVVPEDWQKRADKKLRGLTAPLA
jgi:hypothetical protein